MTSTPLSELTKINTPPLKVGVNLSGAEFGTSTLPGTCFTNYTWSTTAMVDYYAGLGCNLFRIPFRWERIQKTLGGDLDTAELSRLKTLVNYTTSLGHIAVLDVHNYAEYYISGVKYKIGTDEVTSTLFADLWSRLANEFKDNQLVHFGIMNEPHTILESVWAGAAQAAITAIRATGALNKIYLPGTGYSAAYRLISSGWYVEIPNISDPLDNMILEFHQYLDSDNAGNSTEVPSVSIGVDRLKIATDWCRDNGYKAFIGEINAGDRTTGFGSDAYEALMYSFMHMRANSDVWEGVTMWGGGAWWPDNYIFKLAQISGVDDIRLLNMLGVLK